MKNLRILTLFICALLITHSTGAQNKKGRFPVPAGYAAERDVVYSSIDPDNNMLDIYYSSLSEKPLPLAVWIHGGAWRSGDKASARFARELLGEGYAVASINYRLTGTAIFPAQIIDCKSAIRYLRARASCYNIDPQRIAVWGGSAGAHLAALVGTAEDMQEWEKGDYLEYSSRVQAVVDWFGPTDFSRMDDIPGNMVHLEEGSPESVLIGGAVKDNPDKVAYANPITYVNRYNPPFMIYHGKEDLTVLPNQAELLNEAFQKVGLEPEFKLLDNTGHGGREWNNYIPEAKAFLDKHLMDNSARYRPMPPVPEKRWVHSYFSIDPKLNYVRFQSTVVDGDYGYMIALPSSYILSSDSRYPVIYWLPGRGGNPAGVGRFVNRYHEAVKKGEAPEAIIIGVNGINSSMYTNDKQGKFPIETVIIEDLISHVDSMYRTIPEREMRAIDGFSMGGFGAARLGFKHPGTFGVISIVGAAMHRPATLMDKRESIFEEVFGSDLDYCTRHSPWTIVEENADRLKSGVRIRSAVGEKDMLMEKNLDFHERMIELGIPHEFTVISDAPHNYPRVYDNWKGNPFEFYLEAFNSNNNMP